MPRRRFTLPDLPRTGFYGLAAAARRAVAGAIHDGEQDDFAHGTDDCVEQVFAHRDTYVRKAAYLAVGRFHAAAPVRVRATIVRRLNALLGHADELVRQTAINAAGEIGMADFAVVGPLLERGLHDPHPKVRNAVIGSLKKAGGKNPAPTLAFARRFLRHPDKEVRREICHGIELRGRTHPQEVLPLLRELEHDPTARVRTTLVHVLGQIAYKRGCLETVVAHLLDWTNEAVVAAALAEIVDVHRRYRAFAVRSVGEAAALIRRLHGGPVKLRAATPADAPLLRRWDEQPHVLAADPNDEWNWETEFARTPEWREQLIAEVDGRPIGFVQIIDPAREETHYWGDCPPNLRGIDIWIGEAADLGRGYGTAMMEIAIARCFADPAVTAILIDPLASNTRAIRFYERLGFRHVEWRWFGDDDCAVHRLDRAAVDVSQSAVP